MAKKQDSQSVEELTQNELSALAKTDQISRLERESLRDKKVLAELKEREKSSARALVLYERKIKYIRQVIIPEIIALSQELNVGESQKSLLLSAAEKLQSVATISKTDRDFILNKKTKKPATTASVEERFSRLKQEFNQKIGESVNRKRGRPKKSEQSIVADIGLGKKVERKVDTTEEIEDKLNNIFYAVPTAESEPKNVTAIPQTDDSIFDFGEALNPNISLKDIMADIMTESDEPSFDELVKIHSKSKNKKD